MDSIGMFREAWRMWRSDSQADTIGAVALVAVVLVVVWLSQSHDLRESQRNERERLS